MLNGVFDLHRGLPWRDRGMARELKAFVLRWRRPLIIFLDLWLIVVANWLALWLRFDGWITAAYESLFLEMLPWFVLCQGFALYRFRLNEGLWRYTGLWDFQRIVGAVALSTAALYGWIVWGLGASEYPRSVFIIDGILLVGFLVGVRLPARVLRAKQGSGPKRKVLIFGAGDGGERVVREMTTHPGSQYEPLGFVDDEPTLVGQRIHGVKVLGTRRDLRRLVAEHQPQELLLALPRAEPAMLRDIMASLDSSNVVVKIFPGTNGYLDEKSAVSRIRNVSLEDLLPRAPVGVQSQAVLDMIRGGRILITGAGGSIGSELARQIARLKPESLILYERHENSLYTISKELTDGGYSTTTQAVLGDITDVARLQSVMREFRPSIVYHAAAHKHVPLMQLNAGEAFKNNCLGTWIAAEAADKFNVERFVLISTDKAVNPASVMGATKRVAERVVQEIAGRSQTRFLTVRFGNVLGSNGSVVLRFQEQIHAGGPVTVTHPEVRRYFMLISEAVHLVLQASALGDQGGVYALDMGEQIGVVDLARNLIRLSGLVPDKDVPIAFVGLRPGEKLVEELVGEGERADPSPVEKILKISSLGRADLPSLGSRLGASNRSSVLNSYSRVVKELRQLVPGFQMGAGEGMRATVTPVDVGKPEVTLP